MVVLQWLAWAFEWLKWALGAASLALTAVSVLFVAWIALRYGTPVVWRWLSTNTFTHVIGRCLSWALVLGGIAAAVAGGIWLIGRIHFWAILVFAVLIGVWETVANVSRKRT